MATRRNLFGITYLVEKRKFKLLFQGPLAKLGYNPTFYPINNWGYNPTCSNFCLLTGKFVMGNSQNYRDGRMDLFFIFRGDF